MPKFPPLSVPSPSQPLSKHIILRNAAITLVSLTLAALWIALGPHGDFLDGRAFSVSTLDQVTYVFYNWSITLPLDQTTQYRFQAYNNRLVGKTSFVAVDSERRLGDPNGIFVSIETTASPAQFSFRRQTLPGLLACDIVIVDDLPNIYGIDYANIVVYLPPNFRYEALTWATSLQGNASGAFPGHKWAIHMNDLAAAGMHFQNVEITTDSGDINVAGLVADAGSFETKGGKITGNYTIPPANVTFTPFLSGNYTRFRT